MSAKNKSIRKPHLILCEGDDAVYFMIRYLDFLQKAGENEFENFQALDFGGNEQLPVFIKTLQSLPNFNIVKSITIIRDAEADCAAAVQSIRSSLKGRGFPVPEHANEPIENDRTRGSE